MKRFWLLVGLAVCTETHTADQVKFTQDSCEDCHSGTLTHPETDFPLHSQGTSHTDIDCTQCHHFKVGPGLDMVHADCFSCHPESAIDPVHRSVTDYMWDPTNHDFCVSCHPNGLLP